MAINLRYVCFLFGGVASWDMDGLLGMWRETFVSERLWFKQELSSVSVKAWN